MVLSEHQRIFQTIRLIWLRLNRKRFLLSVIGVFLAVYVLLSSFKTVKHVITSQCHYTRLKTYNISSHQTDGETCKIHKPHPDTCKEANKYFGNPTDDLGTRKCHPNPTSDICWFTDTSRLVCSLDFCEDSAIYMARMDLQYGTIRNWQAIPLFSTEKALKFVQESVDQGETFCFIKCAGFIRGIIFPPKILLNKDVGHNTKTNVVIVVLDSISRRHFYRVMRKSIDALREIANDEAIPATVFDFELFQSISMHTFENIRPLFSGIIHGDTVFSQKAASAQEPLGIDVLFQQYKQYGYQTMVQEDLCWHDEWGVLLDNLERKHDSTPTPQRWARFKEVISNHHLDHVGISHITCEVLKAYDMTTLYDKPPKVCFNGRFLSSYFYQYIQAYIRAISNTAGAAPIVLYQHFNTAHTPTGTRIQNMDEELTNFIRFMAREPNTWTIILSDHGHTRTPYGLSEEGLLERYNPLLFMILAQNVAKRLGHETMVNLATNQRRLLTTLDVHKALMTFHQESNKRSKDFRISGVFSKIPSNRTCMDLPLMPLARCQCDGTEQKLKDNSPSHTWLAEFALGALNGYIQQQFSQGEQARSLGMKGYGRCIRMTGKSFRSIVQTKSGSHVTFDLHMDASSVGLQEDEVFRVAVQLEKGIPSLVFYDRQTLYNKFKDCVDESVELKLCICDKRTPLNDAVRRMDSKEIRNVVVNSMFGSKVNVTDLYQGCLLQVTRSHPSGLSLVYEVVNSCQDKTFNVEVKGSTYYVLLSRELPMLLQVEPNTIHFIFSGTRQILNHSHLDVIVAVTVV